MDKLTIIREDTLLWKVEKPDGTQVSFDTLDGALQYIKGDTYTVVWKTRDRNYMSA